MPCVPPAAPAASVWLVSGVRRGLQETYVANSGKEAASSATAAQRGMAGAEGNSLPRNSRVLHRLFGCHWRQDLLVVGAGLHAPLTAVFANTEKTGPVQHSWTPAVISYGALVGAGTRVFASGEHQMRVSLVRVGEVG